MKKECLNCENKIVQLFGASNAELARMVTVRDHRIAVLERAFELACEEIVNFTGNCVYDQLDKELPNYCEDECAIETEKYLCWDRYLIQQAEKELEEKK